MGHALWSNAFLAGVILGTFFGILVGPVVWHWLAWRWWKDADRRLDRSRQVLERMAPQAAEPDGREEAAR
jgi:hypothetical protein